jgi:hypothetical protein
MSLGFVNSDVRRLKIDLQSAAALCEVAGGGGMRWLPQSSFVQQDLHMCTDPKSAGGEAQLNWHVTSERS